MLIFIGHLPASTSEKDIQGFINGAGRPLWRRFIAPRARIGEIEIIRITDPQTQSVEYHGIVDVDPEPAAFSALRSLAGKRLGLAAVEVRHYQARSSYRDQRSVRDPLEQLAISDRRTRDRRRSNLVIERVNITGAPQSGIPSGLCLSANAGSDSL
ncbi:MAG: hypothetical protein KDI63_14665 [Gammaproteobacteria bacterium]|nr:hypothetical protein [Gammaproteobacteria bacterium]